MRGGLVLALAACCLPEAACGVRIDGERPQTDAPQTTPDAADSPDASTDAPPMLGPWGTPKLVPGASTTAAEDDASLSSTTLEMIFAVADPAANNTKDLWYMSRPSPTGTWSAPIKLPFNTTSSEETPRLSDDDLTLYFASSRAGGPGGLDIYMVKRQTVGGAWGTPTLVPGVSTAGTDKWFVPCSGTNSYMVILGTDIGQGTMGSPPTVCAELSSSTGSETGTFLSRDCKTVYFASTSSGNNRIYVATRPAVGMPFTPPQMVVDFLGVGGNQEDPWLSPDLRTFAFVSDVSGTKDVYLSTR